MAADRSPASDHSECERCHAPLEDGDLRCAVCGLGVPERSGASGAKDRLTIQVLRCRGCGSSVDYDPSVQAPRCAFCAEVQEVETLEDPPEEIEEHLPFLVDEAAAREALRAAFRKLGFFHPPDLVQGASVESVRPLWWVAWMFHADALVSWSADSDVDSRRSAWAPHAGQAALRFQNVVVSASRGLGDREVDQLISAYDLGTVRPGRPERDGATVERFDTQRSAARRRVLAAVDAVASERIEREFVPGRSVRNVHTASLLRGLETRRLAFPAWVLAYRYEDRVFRAVVHGQRAERTLAQAPLSTLRVLLVVGIVVVVLGLVLGALFVGR